LPWALIGFARISGQTPGSQEATMPMIWTEVWTALGGVVAGLAALAVVQGWRRLRARSAQRPLREVLGLAGQPALIVAPIRGQDLQGKAIDHRDAFAFGHLFELCHRAGVEARLAPLQRLSDLGDERNVIAIGGPLSNLFTQKQLERFVPGFRLVEEHEASAFAQPLPEVRQRYVTGFEVGSVQLLASESEEYGLLVKLTPRELDQDRTVHLLFGYSGQGTAGAAYYLWKYHRRLHAAFGERAYCTAVKVYRNESYKGVAMSFMDLTAEALGGEGEAGA
jgi:hypothetical protein